VTIPELRKSFAFIYSIEDPEQASGLNYGYVGSPGTGVQVMGPDDGYVVQYTTKTDKFWADPKDLKLGATFLSTPGSRPPSGMVPESAFANGVKYGFQANNTWNQGSISSVGVTPPGSIPETVPSCSWAFSTAPAQGYGEASEQKSTAGWLSALPIFEPHWQIVMADGRSSGWVDWGGERIEFRDAPTYVEKNWGKGFPSKWFWIQCNAFEPGEDRDDGVLPELSVTAVGAERDVPVLGKEIVGLIAIHYEGSHTED